ncbi:hypothetical protein VTN49DRAFT_1664 [Thermomyces lanuginosus]|uniref:uncharacterized protein n=1 Tax=Thermomyces lanuginosus TaxID=5541 RepID=UPI0037441411
MPAPNAPGTSLSPVRPSTGERLPANLEPDDVYLFPTRSAAMYRLHQYLHKANGNEYKSVAFGPVFVSAFYILREWGAGCLEIVRNSDEDMQQLQEFCEIEISADRKVQAVYVEFPCHPNFECCDLYTLRRLADVYQFLLVVDASAGDICNIDLSSVADVFIFAPFHAMCGITVLDPLNRPTHQRLRKLFSENYRNEVFHLDAEALVRSTSNYRASLRRTEQPCKPCRNFFAKPGGKSIKYRVQGFTPGYGGLISIEFEKLEYAQAFFNAAELCPSSNLRESVTCIYPSNGALYGCTPEDEFKAECRGWSMA